MKLELIRKLGSNSILLLSLFYISKNAYRPIFDQFLTDLDAHDMNSQFSDVQHRHLDGDSMPDRIRSDISNRY